MNGTQVPGTEMFTCDQCRTREVTCSGAWKFHIVGGKYLLQCKTCRLKRRGCSFRQIDEEEPQATPRKQETKGKKRERQESPIDISDDSSDDASEMRAARPSSRPEKRINLESKNGKDWDGLEKALLAARKRKVEIQTKAEIEMAKVNAIIEETERKVKE